MIFFVLHAFNCILHFLVIQSTLNSSLFYAGHSINPSLEIHSIAFRLFSGYHSIGPRFLNHSIDSPFLKHSIDSEIMPVVTQSMAKQLALSDITITPSAIVDSDTITS